MGRLLKVLLSVAGSAVLVVGVTPGAANAARAGEQQAIQIADHPTEQQASAAAGCDIRRFGYWGTQRCGSHDMSCDWNRDGYVDEIFIVSHRYTIWHIWPGGGDWREMPNHGKAWDTWNCYWNGNGKRQVEVLTYNDGIWYSYYSGGWRGWYRY